MENESGSGNVTAFQVFPGIYLLHSDFHMQECPGAESDDANILWLDFCREGRVEWEISKDKYVYLESGSYIIDVRVGRKIILHFPMSHYHGISLRIHTNDANQALAEFVKGVSIDIYALRDKFISNGQPFIAKGNEIIRRIFEEIHNFIIASPGQHYTVGELSKRFGVPDSSLKRCFKGVYGTAVCSFMRSYRMDMAGHLLVETADTVAAVSAKVGYTNCSEFSEAFKAATGMTPIAYRKSKNHREYV